MIDFHLIPKAPGGREAKKLVDQYRAQIMGSENLHRHWTGTLHFTDGMLYLAQVCGAHWLLDAVASHQMGIRRKHGEALSRFQVWKLAPNESKHVGGWILSAWSDTPGDIANGSKMLTAQIIRFSDFPVELTPFEFWVENSTAMFKEER